jgi:hypothetical protein
MSEIGHLRRFWHVRVISGQGVISEVPVVRFCRLRITSLATFDTTLPIAGTIKLLH